MTATVYQRNRALADEMTK